MERARSVRIDHPENTHNHTDREPGRGDHDIHLEECTERFQSMTGAPS